MPAITPTGPLRKVAENIEAAESYTIRDKLIGGATVEMGIAYRGGRYICREVRVFSKTVPVTADLLRQVKVAELLREGVQQALDNQVRVWRRPENRPRPTAEVIEAVARVYKVAFLVGENPKQAVARAFGVPIATAGRWIALARKAKHLGRGQARRAGI
jgi:hypothetical protein